MSYHQGGGGLSDCGATIENNTIVSNFADSSGGLGACRGMILNCIVWGNKALYGPQLFASTTPTYSCIEGWAGGGVGSVAFDPRFVGLAGGDFHLSPSSPCIDLGDPASPFSNEPEPNGARINMGAYGNTAEAESKSPDADGDPLRDDWELQWFGDLDENAAGDPDADGIPNLTEYHLCLGPHFSSQHPRRKPLKGTLLPDHPDRPF